MTDRPGRMKRWPYSGMQARQFCPPAGWPEGTPVIQTSIQGYRALWPCHRRLTPKYRSYVSAAAQRKRVFHLRSRAALKQFLASARNE